VNVKTVLLALCSSLLGLAAAGGMVFWSYSDLGPDFDWIEADVPSYKNYEHEQPEQRPQKMVEVIGGEEYDFGVMDRGETRKRVFVIKNNTDEPIQLTKGPSTCKCAVHTLEKNLLPPGGQCNIDLEWTAKSLDTEFRQSATINTTSSARPKILLSVFGRVLQIVQPVPRDIAFSDVTVRDSREGEFTLFGFKDADLEILEYRWTFPETAEYFEFEYTLAPNERLAERDDAVAAIDCKVRMKPGLPLGPVRQALEIVTSSAPLGAIDVPVRARIVGDISLHGKGYNDRINQIILGPVSRMTGRKFKMFMMVKGPHAPNFEVTKISCDPPNLFLVDVAEPRELRDGAVRMFPIAIEIPAGAKPVNYSGGDEHPLARLTFETSHPETAEIGLDIRFAIVE